MSESPRPPVHERWAHLRFSVIGPLLSAPPERGELQAALEALAARPWLHPVTGTPTQFGVSTIERWYSAESFVMRSGVRRGTVNLHGRRPRLLRRSA